MWRDASKRELAAEAMKITAKDLTGMNLVDDVVPEPPGGAHHDWDAAARMVGEKLQWHLSELQRRSPEELVRTRYEKFREMGKFFTS